MRDKNIWIYTLILFFIIVMCLCSCKVPQKTETVIEKIRIDSFYIEGLSSDFGNDSFIRVDTFKTIETFLVDKECPITVIHKQKIKRSNNIDNSVTEKLKHSLLIKDSQIDSLNAVIAKKPIGQQTNNNQKWWVWLLIGIGVGGISYQGIRSAITKKL